MATSAIPHPPIVSPEEWLAERKQLLLREKELTRLYFTWRRRSTKGYL
jgi:predicted dithiol-disulfide oxidoreductase (DUF899 family)